MLYENLVTESLDPIASSLGSVSSAQLCSQFEHLFEKNQQMGKLKEYVWREKKMEEYVFRYFFSPLQAHAEAVRWANGYSLYVIVITEVGIGTAKFADELPKPVNG